MANLSALVGVLSLVSLAVMASANGPNMSTDKYAKPCKAAQNCYDSGKCRDNGKKMGEGFRDCYFQCLWTKVRDEPNGIKFFKEMNKVADFCDDKRGPKNENKVMKCAIKKVKKDACENYFGATSGMKREARAASNDVKIKVAAIKNLGLPKWMRG